MLKLSDMLKASNIPTTHHRRDIKLLLRLKKIEEGEGGEAAGEHGER